MRGEPLPFGHRICGIPIHLYLYKSVHTNYMAVVSQPRRFYHKIILISHKNNRNWFVFLSRL